jgi:hypothetical protein
VVPVGWADFVHSVTARRIIARLSGSLLTDLSECFASPLGCLMVIMDSASPGHQDLKYLVAPILIGLKNVSFVGPVRVLSVVIIMFPCISTSENDLSAFWMQKSVPPVSSALLVAPSVPPTIAVSPHASRLLAVLSESLHCSAN